MTDQRMFPFIVNGQFWKRMAVDEKIICHGYIYIVACHKLSYNLLKPNYNPQMINMKQIVFQLAEVAECKNSFTARWFQGFWIVDDELYLEDDKLYLKEKG